MKTNSMYELRIQQLKKELQKIEENKYNMDAQDYLIQVKENITMQKELMKKEAEALERLNPTPKKKDMRDFLIEIESHLREIGKRLNEEIDIENINVKSDEKAEKINEFILGGIKDMSIFTQEEVRVMNVIKRNM